MAVIKVPEHVQRTIQDEVKILLRDNRTTAATLERALSEKWAEGYTAGSTDRLRRRVYTPLVDNTVWTEEKDTPVANTRTSHKKG